MYKLLIADDEPLVCVGVQSMLDWASLDIEIVGIARNGEQAAEMIAETQPDIVITDIKMPLKTGLALARESQEKYGEVPAFIILTSYEDFAFARQAIQAHAVDYLVKLELDAESLSASIRKAVAVVSQHRYSQRGVTVRGNILALQEKFFVRLFNDLFDNEQIYEVQKKELEIAPNAKSFLVGNCELFHPSEAMDKQTRLSLYASSIPLARETLTRYLPCYLVPLDMGHFTVVFCLENPTGHRALISEALQKTTELLYGYLGIRMHTALGTVVDDLRQISVSYRQSQRCAHGMTDADPIVYYNVEESNTATDYISEIADIRQGIRKAFEELNTAALHETLTRLAEIYTTHPDDLLHAMDTTCNILYMAISLLPEGEMLLEQIFADNAEGHRSLYRLRDAESIAAWVLRLRDGCCEFLQTRRQSYKERVVEEVKAYIQENLDKKLSLYEVAAVFNFNPNYLSRLFSQYAGEGFVEYTTVARITAAKEMLLRGDGKIYEIAEKLGFESSFYFSKVFKKVEGISPREYLYSLNKESS